MDELYKLDDLYNLYPNKDKLWMLMRCISVMLDVLYNIHFELHEPRRSLEYFTYICDKYWAKAIYGLRSDNLTYEKIHEEIHNGTRSNLINYWYPILKEKKYQNHDNLTLEIKYYMYSLKTIKELKISRIFCNSHEKTIFDKLYNQDYMIVDIIIELRNYNELNINLSNKILKKIIYRTDAYIVVEFYTYLSGKKNDISLESENKNNISELIKEYL